MGVSPQIQNSDYEFVIVADGEWRAAAVCLTCGSIATTASVRYRLWASC